jgi:hypothetical protein
VNRQSKEVSGRFCWKMTSCPETIRNDCPAYRFPSIPCWQIEGTYCKVNAWGAQGDDNSICLACKVYLESTGKKSLTITLRGHGIKLLVK